MRAVWLFFDEFEVRQEFRRKAPRVYICPQTRSLGRRRQFFSEDCTKSLISGYRLLTIFGHLAYFFGRFRNFGTVVEGRTGKTRVPEAAQRLPWLGIGEESPVQTRGSIGSRVTRTKASVASIGRASHS